MKCYMGGVKIDFYNLQYEIYMIDLYLHLIS